MSIADAIQKPEIFYPDLRAEISKRFDKRPSIRGVRFTVAHLQERTHAAANWCCLPHDTLSEIQEADFNEVVKELQGTYELKLDDARKTEGLIIHERTGVYFGLVIDRQIYNGLIATEALKDLARHRGDVNDALLREFFFSHQDAIIRAGISKVKSGDLTADNSFALTSDNVKAVG